MNIAPDINNELGSIDLFRSMMSFLSFLSFLSTHLKLARSININKVKKSKIEPKNSPSQQATMANVEGGASHRFAEAEIRRLARSRHQPDVLCFTLAHASKYNHKYKQIQIQIYHSSIFVMDHAVQTYLHKYILCHSFIL